MIVLGRLAAYLGPYRARVAYAVAAMCAVAAFNGLSVLLLKPVVDRVLIARDFPTLWLVVAGLPLLMAVKTAVSYAQNYLMSWLGQRVIQDIRADLFRRLIAADPAARPARDAAGTLSRATGDLSALQAALTTVPLYLIRDTMTLLALVASLFYLHARFAALSLLTLPLAAAALVVLSRKMRAASLQSQATMDRLYRRFQEGLAGQPSAAGELSRFDEENASFWMSMMRYLRATALAGPLMEFSGAVVGAAILYLGGSEVIEGRMTPGAFFAFLGAFFAAYAPAKNLARSNSELQRALASGERVFQLLDESRPPAAPAAAPPC